MVQKLKSSDLTIANVLAFFDQYLVNGSNHRCKFSSQFFSKNVNMAEAIATPSVDTVQKQVVVIKDPSLFKRLLPLLPVQSYEV